jgi:hypothetical protein
VSALDRDGEEGKEETNGFQGSRVVAKKVASAVFGERKEGGRPRKAG